MPAIAQGPGIPVYDSGVGRLEQERNTALQRLEQLRTYYDRPDAAQLLQQLQGRASGQDAPFTQDVIGSLLAGNADASAGMARSEGDMLRQRYANAGLSGSGIETSAMVMSRRRASALARAGRREITSRAALENYQARERAQSQVMQYVQQRQMAEQAAGMAEVDFRSRMQAVAPDQTYGQVETNPRGGGGGFPFGGGGFSMDDGMDPTEPYTPTWQPPTPRSPAAPQTPGGLPVTQPVNLLGEQFTGPQIQMPSTGGRSNRPGGPNIDQALANAQRPKYRPMGLASKTPIKRRVGLA